MNTSPITAMPTRVDWVDYAKGICIILVVMMHSTLGVEKAMVGALNGTGIGTGFLTLFIEWARPFRMPDFFLISGLFLARRIGATWRSYANSKVIHFAYFYLLWMSIQFIFKGFMILKAEGAAALLREYALALVEPFGTLWFIYLLAIFFVVTKLLRPAPPILVFAVAAVLEMLPIATGWIVIDEFAARFVYFFAGYWLSSHVFSFARRLDAAPAPALLAGLAVWAAANAVLVYSGASALPGAGLAAGFVGAGAVVATATLCARTRGAAWLRYLGAHSIVIYLAFFFFMALSRVLLLRFAPWLGPDAISALVTLCGVTGPVILHLAVKNTAARFLFERPKWIGLSTLPNGAKDWHSARHEQPQELRRTEIR
jgi:uncharacterized membrane protein YcfT